MVSELKCGLKWLKEWFQRETSFIFYFYFGSVSRETDAKLLVFFWIFWHQKMKLADGFMRWKTELDGIIILTSFTHVTISQFHFWCQKIKKNTDIFASVSRETDKKNKVYLNFSRYQKGRSSRNILTSHTVPQQKNGKTVIWIPWRLSSLISLRGTFSWFQNGRSPRYILKVSKTGPRQ